VSGAAPVLRAAGRVLRLERPLLMGIVNATPDSFSDEGELPTTEARLARGRELLAAGADILDVGGESASGHRPAVAADEEIARVVPVVEGLVADGALVSVDTHKPAVAAAAVAAGAAMVNDVSGLRDPALAEVCADSGAALVIMHTRVEPKGTLLDPEHYEDVVADVTGFLRERMEAAIAAGVGEEQILLDPGPDFAKTPAQTVAVLRRLDAVLALGRPVLLAVSRKDFVGAITGRPARARGAAAAVDFLAVRGALRGERQLAPAEGLTPDRYPGSR
jgi:dihydropteroate synthase